MPGVRAALICKTQRRLRRRTYYFNPIKTSLPCSITASSCGLALIRSPQSEVLTGSSRVKLPRERLIAPHPMLQAYISSCKAIWSTGSSCVISAARVLPELMDCGERPVSAAWSTNNKTMRNGPLRAHQSTGMVSHILSDVDIGPCA